jgi:hypothetical protein
MQQTVCAREKRVRWRCERLGEIERESACRRVGIPCAGARAAAAAVRGAAPPVAAAAAVGCLLLLICCSLHSMLADAYLLVGPSVPRTDNDEGFFLIDGYTSCHMRQATDASG